MIIVRSSSSKEDSFKTSNAGHYESVMGINSADPEQVRKAIAKVIHSYMQDSEDIEMNRYSCSVRHRMCITAVLYLRGIFRKTDPII